MAACVRGLFFYLCLGAALAFDWETVTPLDEYVQGDDGYYSYVYIDQYVYEGATVHIVNMTSQKWMDESFTSRSVWWHIMAIAIPDDFRHHDAGMLYIDGGSNSDENPPAEDFWLILAIAAFARDTGSVGAFILQVPNQRITFYNDPDLKSRNEDAIIAWTWRTFIDEFGERTQIPLRFPMTKAAKRGLDCIHDVAKDQVPSSNVRRFVVTGASKRGWTTWSLAATDRRVEAAMPLVMSLLNFEETLMKHYQSLDGAWSFAFSDFYNEDLTMNFLDDIVVNPEYGLWNHEDMFRYKERLGLIPKLMLSASGDQFFLVHDSHSWWDQMPGPGGMWMTMLPNAGHSLAPWYGKVFDTLIALWSSILEDVPMPQLSWDRGETADGGYILLTTDTIPVNLTAWEAVTLPNDTRRDFRLATKDGAHPVVWRANDVEVLPDQGDGLVRYYYETSVVEDRWVGFFIDLRYEGPLGHRFFLTSEVQVIPDTFPTGPCSGADCYSELV